MAPTALIRKTPTSISVRPCGSFRNDTFSEFSRPRSSSSSSRLKPGHLRKQGHGRFLSSIAATTNIQLSLWDEHKKRPTVTAPPTCCGRSLSSSPQKDNHSTWESMTDRLVTQVPVGTFRPATWHEAEETIKFWLKEEENVEQCWKLLDRLALEETSKPERNPVLATELVNAIVNLWRKQFKSALDKNKIGETSVADITATMNSLGLPSKVADKLLSIEAHQTANNPNNSLIRLDAKTHAMILDAASHYTQDPEEGVYFADSYLKSWLEDYYQTGKSLIAPDVVAVGSVIHAWVASGLPDAAQRAEDWMEQLKDETVDIEPNAFLYTSMISAWARVGNPYRAQEWLLRMQNDKNNLAPDLTTWNALLKAWRQNGKDPRAAEHAESILWKMRQLFDAGDLEEGPNVVSYSIVLDAWAKKAKLEDPKGAAARAQSLLDQMTESENASVHPNTISYNTVISAHARAGNVREAEALLEEMMVKSSENDRRVEPNVQTFATVLSAFSRVGTIQAAERAESLLRNMPQMDLQPNIQCYSNVITCWKNVTTPKYKEAAHHAQVLFQEAKEHKHIEPDIVAYTSMMNVWGHCGEPSKAETLLETLLQKYERSNQNPRFKPNVQTFTTVLSAWSHSRDPDAPERAEALLQRMTPFGIQPNEVSYSTLLDAWAKSNHPHAADKAQAILDHMRTSPYIKPNVISYTTVVKAYAKQGRAEEAEALLEDMLTQEGAPKPDVYTFSSVLHAWSKSQCPRAAERAEAILVQLHNLYSRKVIDRPPNVFCYSNVLACWAKSQKPGSAQRAQHILETMKRHNVSPNLVSYNTVMNAWANESYSNANAVHQIDSLLKELDQLSSKDRKLKPDEFTYRAIWKALNTSHLFDKLKRLNQLLESMAKNGVEPTRNMIQQLRREKRKQLKSLLK